METIIPERFTYRDYAFGRFVFKHKEANAIIIVRNGNIVTAGKFTKEQMPDNVKYVFRAKWK